MSASFAIGIDLGTTNTALAWARLDADETQVELFAAPQITAPGTLETRRLLPSFLYLAPEEESAGGSLDVPWAAGRDFAVGEYARRRSAEAPDRTVGGAKSWLCHSRVDRRQPILPWQAPPDVPQVSPVTAARRYLEHVIAAWQAEHPEAPIDQQQVVLTVPASFDAAARELTREAALAAGLPQDLVLLEEPQAALYAWLASRGDAWRKQLAVGDKLLVLDVGGGTTDLTLIDVAEEDGELMLRRAAVGNHLLVGGDNMDLALAHHVAGQFAEKNVSLDPWQSVSLWHSCRAAKESLLAGDGPESHPVSVLGRGKKLIGGTVSVDVERQAATQLLLDGFFPKCKIDETPLRQRASGFQELGLPYEADTAVTRHVAAFLTAHGEEGAARPAHVLLNGGVFKSAALTERLGEVLAGWFGKKQAPAVLEVGDGLDFAVARGAAYYAWTKSQGGVRIRGGAARSYYVGIETVGLAIPGAPRPLRALCVVPMGMEEGTEIDVPSAEIGLVLGEPARFRFFSSSVRKDDQPGALLSRWDPDELVETDPLETTLPRDDAIDEPYAPVKFHSKITELGVFELWCHSQTTAGRWKLEFSVREEE